MYNRERSPEVNDVEGLAAASTKHLESPKQKDKTEGSFIEFENKMTINFAKCLLHVLYIPDTEFAQNLYS